MKLTLALPDGYADWLSRLKQEIASSQQRAALAVNAELVGLYGRIGQEILSRQESQGWGAKVIDRLALDLKEAFPEMRGWSASNLKYMRFFAQHCPNGLIGQQPADQLPWFHIVTLLTKLSSPAEREWYAVQTVQNGWSRTTLELNIKNHLLERQGAAVSNFVARLPSPDSALAHETLKDPYLKCYVVVELKATAFRPEHAGQLNFYLAAVDAQIKADDDKPTIGLLLCKQQNRLVAEYALSGIDKPIGVAEYQLLRDLPERLGGSLPSIEAIEAELAGEMAAFKDEPGFSE